MLVLLPLLWLWSVWARETGPPKDTKYVIRPVTSCPEVGYFFSRETSPNSLSSLCYLCFCQADGTAVCWQRENKRCDVTHYNHGVGKRDTRVRRSPLGIGDIFFRDAARDIFNKQLPQVCKPYETSFSEGCPPVPGDKEAISLFAERLITANHRGDAALLIASLPWEYDIVDWCTGCTVCDCDANGRWDCHVLSFCPDKKDKNKVNKNKKPIKGPPPKKNTASRKKATTTAAKKPPTKKPTTRKPPAKRTNKQINIRSKAKPNNTVQKTSNASPKPLVIKKDPISKKPLLIKKDHSQIALNTNETAKITQEVYKKVVSAVQKMITKKFAASMPALKNIQKRSLEKITQPCMKNSKNAKKNVNGKFKSVGPNKKQYKKTITKKATAQKKKFAPPKKKFSPPKYNNQNNKKIKRNSPKPVNNKIGTPTKKPTKPPKRVWRSKREISDSNVIEIVDTLDVNNEKHLNVTTEPTSVDTIVIANVTDKNNYYQYSVITSKPTVSTELVIDTEYANFTNDSNNHTSRDSFVVTNEETKIANNYSLQNNTSIDNENKSKVEHNLSVDKITPDYNDLKFKKWSQIKILKSSPLFKKLLGLNSTKNTVNATAANNDHAVRFKNYTNDFKRIVTPKSIRKYNNSKIVHTLRCKTRNLQKANSKSSFKERIFTKIDDLQNMLKKFLYELRKNDTTTKIKPKRFNVVKYLKNFFPKLFKKRVRKGDIMVNHKAVFNKHVINIICNNLEDCDMTQVKNPLLNKKIKQLYSDSITILKTINIIKGLLHFLDEPKSEIHPDSQNTKANNESVKLKLKQDIHKLSAILKDRYVSNHKLSSTEMTQIQYIKRNTQHFISSVGRFANNLNDIIQILTKKPDTMRKNPVTRDIKIKMNVTLSDLGLNYYIKLKDLFDKYALIQEALVQRMQESLKTYKRLGDENSKKGMIYRNKNSTAAIVSYSNNIIKNLKKLKNLAATLASSKHRRKRDILRDDDAMEYLLTLMEYLLKQNHPLDAAPVNDGIDLLIEAIKSAPDIKPIKKKVLQTIPLETPIEQSTEQQFNKSREEENISADINKISKEYNDTNDTLPETVEQISYQGLALDRKSDDPNLDEAQIRRNGLIFEDTNTEPVYYKKVPETPDDGEVPSNNNAPMLETTVVPSAYGMPSNQETTEHNNFEKLENAVHDDTKKIEVFIGDVDDDDANVEVASTTVAADEDVKEAVTITVPIVPPDTTEFKLAELKERQKIVNSVDVSGNSDGDKRVAFDWLDEGEEQDTKEVKSMQNSTTTQEAQVKTKVTTKTLPTTIKQIQIDNVSSITKELSDEDARRKKSNIEDIMYKKQMDLLNSLDYGTEKSEAEESDSKDGDERYSGDVFQSYF